MQWQKVPRARCRVIDEVLWRERERDDGRQVYTEVGAYGGRCIQRQVHTEAERERDDGRQVYTEAEAGVYRGREFRQNHGV